MSRQELVEHAQAVDSGEQSLKHLSEACRQLRARAWAGGRHSEALGESAGSPDPRFDHGLGGAPDPVIWRWIFHGFLRDKEVAQGSMGVQRVRYRRSCAWRVSHAGFLERLV